MSLLPGYEVAFNQTASTLAEVIGIDCARKAAAQSKPFIHQGAVALFCALALGILNEISRSVAGRGADRSLVLRR